MNKYPNLFSPLKIGKLTLRNRICASPTAMINADIIGGPDERYCYYYGDKARGGAAVVTVSETAVNDTDAMRRFNSDYGIISKNPDYMTIQKQRFVKLTNAIARHGAIPSIQIFHSGDLSSPQFIGGQDPIGPYGYTRDDGVNIREMDKEKIKKIVKEFEDTAAMLKFCGFQMIQIHGAHGWLLAQFLSHATNKRTDEYGGSLENRARFCIEVIDAVRRAVGPGFPIEYRISGDEHLGKNGLEIDEVVEFCKMIEEKVESIHVSAGSYYSTKQYTFPTIYVPHACNLHLAAAVKKMVSKCYVATVGAHYDPVECERIIKEGEADLIYIGRQLIADPQWPVKARTGREDEIRPCLRCLNCLGNFSRSRRECDVNPTVGQELYILNESHPVEYKRKVLIAGGGPGGMQAAITAAVRGHEVILAEKTDRLGGVLKITDKDAWKFDLRRYRDYLIHMVKASKVKILMNTNVTPEFVNSIAPDVLIVAVGGHVIKPGFKGVDQPHVMSGLDAYYSLDKIGRKALIIGGGLVGCEVGTHLAKEGKEVTILEMTSDIGAGANHIALEGLRETLAAYNVSIRTGITCNEITKSGVKGIDNKGEAVEFEADTVIYALGVAPEEKAVEELRSCDADFFFTIGDCVRAGRVHDAVHNGYWAAMDIF
jgi:2,4-dienoyl-CoA reductase-like NADH-dependent reductase (Old Yellow Enzyme family)/thioredoxin reductase